MACCAKYWDMPMILKYTHVMKFIESSLFKPSNIDKMKKIYCSWLDRSIIIKIKQARMDPPQQHFGEKLSKQTWSPILPTIIEFMFLSCPFFKQFVSQTSPSINPHTQNFGPQWTTTSEQKKRLPNKKL